MSLPGTDSNRRAEKAAEQTGDYAAHNTASDAPAPAAGQPDPLLSLLRPPQAGGELGRRAHFAVTRLLGRGGMGAVFAADDLLLHRKVALKVMRPELTARPEARERFLREAQTAGGLEHDHVITVHHVAEDNGVWFIAMPLLKGEALDERLKREARLPIPAVLKLGRETAEGLAAAHAQGLVHRDVKPANLWLEGTGEAGGAGFRRIKILDFGLARAVQDDQHLTAAGGVLGMPAYMAPEQAAGEEVDHRTDLFSLGVVLYRCCAGETPFHGPNTMATLSALANKNAVPVAETNPAVPAALADLIMRLLAKAPDDRPQSAEEVAEGLRRIEQEHATVTAQALPPAPRRRRVSALALCVAALLGLGLAAVAAVIVVKVRTPDGKETQVTAPAGSNVDVDPKGNVTVTLPADAPATPANPAATADPPELEFRLKDGSSPIYGLVVAPDGKTVVAGSADGKLRVWDLETRQVVRSYLASSGVTALALHPDGKTVAAMCNDGSLFTWDIEKGMVIRQYTGYPVHAPGGLTFARKGDLIVTPDRETQAVICWDAKTGEHRVLARFTDEKNPLDGIAASTDGELVAVTTADGPVRLVKLSSGEVISTLHWFGITNPVFGSDGKELLIGVPRRGMLVWNQKAMRPSVVFSSEIPSAFWGISVAPNGRFLSAVGGPRGTVDLWVRDRLIPWRAWSGLAKGASLRVAFTPDGRRLLSTHEDGTICVFRLPKDIPAWHGFPPLDPDWLARTIKLPADEQIKEVTAELARRNPGFTESLTVLKDADGQVWNAWVQTAHLEDLSPFRGFSALCELGVEPKEGIGKVWDLSCLEEMHLSRLHLRSNSVWDISPLRDLPLTELLVDGNPLCDLSPLQKMKLSCLAVCNSNVDDLSPLHGMPLESVWLHYTPIKDLSPLKGAPLKYLDLSPNGGADFESMRGLSIQEISLLDVEQTGLTAAQTKVLRSMPTLKTINGKPAADFWKAIDAGDKPKPGG